LRRVCVILMGIMFNELFQFKFIIIFSELLVGDYMNRFLELSIQYANQRSYLDDLFSIYPTIPEGIRDIDNNKWSHVEKNFKSGNKIKLIESLLALDLFPLKDSYVAYLKRDSDALSRNPRTVDRLFARLNDMGLDEIYQKCSEPKETNRQIGPMFRNWLGSGAIGIEPLSYANFIRSKSDAILIAGDAQMKDFAAEYLDYEHDKGLDFIARIKGTHYIGEAKFLTDFGGHQNAQFADAKSTLHSKSKARHIAILDGVVYIRGKNKMYTSLTSDLKNHDVMSALVLQTFLFAQ
jgi:hypothetical protein